MRIVCPSCAAEYEVPAERLRPRRMVRCARCGGEWMAIRETPAATPPTEPAREPAPAPASAMAPDRDPPSLPHIPEVSALDRLAVPLPVARRPGGIGLIAAWLLSFALIAGAATLCMLYRGAIEQAWPPSARLLG